MSNDVKAPHRQSVLPLLVAEDSFTDKPEGGVKLVSKNGNEEEIITDWKRIALRCEPCYCIGLAAMQIVS